MNSTPLNPTQPQPLDFKAAKAVLVERFRMKAPAELRAIQDESDKLDQLRPSDADAKYNDYHNEVIAGLKAGRRAPTPLLTREQFQNSAMVEEMHILELKQALHRSHWPKSRALLLKFAEFAEDEAAKVQADYDRVAAAWNLPPNPCPVAETIAKVGKVMRQQVDATNNNLFAVGGPRDVLGHIGIQF